MAYACIFADSVHHRLSDFRGSIYERASELGHAGRGGGPRPGPGAHWVEDAKLEAGVRSIVAAPLHYQDALIGTLSLVSPKPGDLAAAHLPKLREVLPLFSMAVKRSIDELNTRIQAFIKEKCTAIHPVVEWRFRKAVLDGFERQDPTLAAGDMGPIVFENVYPLYALSDVRGSSTQRAWAIQADLLAQLGLARDVRDGGLRRRPLPILDHLASASSTARAGRGDAPRRRRGQPAGLPAQRDRAALRPPPGLRQERPRPDRGLPQRARSPARDGLPAARGLRGRASPG